MKNITIKVEVGGKEVCVLVFNDEDNELRLKTEDHYRKIADLWIQRDIREAKERSEKAKTLTV